LIATAMLDSGETDKLIGEFAKKRLDDPRADAALRVAVGQAQLRVRQHDDAAASFAAALASDPANLQAQLGQARLAALTGKLDEAMAAVDGIAAKHPDSSDAFLLQGSLRLAG
jgi:Tfp pilus assembly protein PilF